MDFKAAFERAREVGRDVVAKEALETDKNYTWHEQGMRAMLEAGLGGLVVPREYGGLGFGLPELARVCEVLGEESGSMGLCFGMHCVGSAVIAAKPTPAQIGKYLVPIAAGKHITTLSLSESGTGAHFYYPQTTLAPDGAGNFILEGNKTFVTNGAHADSYVISTVASAEDAPVGHFSCIVVDKDSEGMQWEERWRGIGMRGNSSLNLKLDRTRVPEENLLGQEGDQIWYIFKVVAPFFIMAMSGTYLGLAQAAMSEARDHLIRRTYSHSGLNLSDLPVLQHHLGEIWCIVERTRRLIYYAAEEASGGGELALPGLCSAKIEVSRCLVETVNKSMTLMGGIGYREGGKIERILRDSRAADVMSPTTDLLTTWVGRALLDQPLLD